jgi:hypothetical protein
MIIKRDCEIDHVVAQTFSRLFYHGLLIQMKTVLKAFNDTILELSKIPDKTGEAEKFLLLPNKNVAAEYHNRTLHLPDTSGILNGDVSNPKPYGTIHRHHYKGKLEQVAEIYRMFHRPYAVPYVTVVTGEPGVGKSQVQHFFI